MQRLENEIKYDFSRSYITLATANKIVHVRVKTGNPL